MTFSMEQACRNQQDVTVGIQCKGRTSGVTKAKMQLDLFYFDAVCHSVMGKNWLKSDCFLLLMTL